MGIIKTKNLHKLNNCWLSPQGEVITGDDEFDANSWHEDLGFCIIRDLENFPSKDAAFKYIRKYCGGGSTEWLEDGGFIRLHGFRVEANESKWVIPPDSKISFQQKMVIRNWCKLNNVNWDAAVMYC